LVSPVSIGTQCRRRYAMKVLLVGAGGQGAPCASILAHDPDISAVILGDIDPDLANRVKDRIGSDKITAMRLDAGDVGQLQAAARGVDAVINLTVLRFNPNIMQAALHSGAHYVDTATDEPIWSQLLKGEPLYLDREFKEAGLTALIGCGATPGITNVLARYACDKLDRVDEIRVRAGSRSLGEEEVVSGWDPGWSPEVALMDYSLPSPVFEDGALVDHPPFSGVETYGFPEPVGQAVVAHHCHEEAPFMGRFIGRGLRYVDFKYPIDPIAGALVKMGFASYDPIDVKGVEVAPIDVVSAMAPAPVGGFFAESEEMVQLPPPSVHAMVVEVKGVESGEAVTYRLSAVLPPAAEEELAIFRRLGTVHIYVALPAVIGAKMCVAGVGKGVITPECLDPVAFLKAMSDMGAPLKFTEACTRAVAIS
jgi:saccharopine dehydrogenase (NAD+, L-lysine-forming)